MSNKLNNALLIMCFALISVSFLIQPVFATGERRSVHITATGGIVHVTCTSDLVCDDGLWCNGPERCLPTDRLADETGCTIGIRPPKPQRSGWPSRARFRCDESGARWIVEGGDADGDGHGAIDFRGDDCDDNDADVFPGNYETCDNKDDDCNPMTFGQTDSDGDGYIDSSCTNPKHR